MNKFLTIILILALIITGAKLYLLHLDSRHVNTELKKLKENTDIVIQLDSAVTAKEKRLLDSVKVLRESLERIKKNQHDENTKLRKRNEDLERRFRDLDVSDRPDF